MPGWRGCNLPMGWRRSSLCARRYQGEWAPIHASLPGKTAGGPMKLLYSRNLNPRVAVAVARYLKAPVEYVPADPRNPANTEAFRRINPNALVPVLVEEGQDPLWEVDAIACRLSTLMRSDFWRTGDELARMVMWVSWANIHLNPPAGDVYFYRLIWPTFSTDPADEGVVAQGKARFAEHAAVLDGALAGRDWLVGGRISYADFRVASALPFAERAGLALDDFPNIRAWHGRLMQIPAWADPFAGV